MPPNRGSGNSPLLTFLTASPWFYVCCGVFLFVVFPVAVRWSWRWREMRRTTHRYKFSDGSQKPIVAVPPRLPHELCSSWICLDPRSPSVDCKRVRRSYDRR